MIDPNERHAAVTHRQARSYTRLPMLAAALLWLACLGEAASAGQDAAGPVGGILSAALLGGGVLLGVLGTWGTGRWLGRAGGRASAASAGGARDGAGANFSQAMEVLSQLNRGILSGARFERVVDVLLRSAPTIFGHSMVGVTVLDREEKRPPRTYYAGAAGTRTVEPALVEAELLQQLASTSEGHTLTSLAGHAFLAPLLADDVGNVLLVPVFLDARLAAILIVGGNDMKHLAGSRPMAGEVADRLSLALTAATRDLQLHRRSNYDEVTTLPNRRYLQERLAQEINRALRESRGLTLLFIDLDQFKHVNDLIGHAGGDVVLEQAGRRMRHCLRSEDVVARFGGDEFVVLLPAVGVPGDAARVADKLLQALSDPFVVRTQAHQLGATVGISMFPADARTAERLMRNADLAMSRAKASGGGQFMFYDEKMHVDVQRRLELEADLRAALGRSELRLVYQPQVDMRSGRVAGVEALLRWDHPRLGAIGPVEFIPIAEQSGLIEDIGIYVRAAACRQFGLWQAQGLAPPRVAVNISAREVRAGAFAARVRAELLQHQMRGGCLDLELTESVLADGSTQVKTTLAELRELELGLAIDDFGTGYSSMSYLRDYPFTSLKVDRAFVSGIGSDPGADAIVRAILGVAQGLDLDVVAEGIETAAQRDFLAAAGCQIGQGYFWSQPLPAEEFGQLMREWLANPRPMAAIYGADLVRAGT